MIENPYKLLIDCSFGIDIALNDTWYYACADSENIDSDDVPELIPYIEKYGYDAVLAYIAIKREHDPQIPDVISENFYKAKEELQILADKDEILCYQHIEKREKEKEKKLFDGQTISWTTYEDIRVNRFKKFIYGNKKLITVINVASLPDGTFAIGKNRRDTKERLIKKYNKKHE